MANDIDDLFGKSDFVTTPSVAAFVGLSETKTREYAADLGVGMAGNAFIWTRQDVEALLDELGPEDEEDDEEELEDEGDEDLDEEEEDDEELDDGDDEQEYDA